MKIIAIIVIKNEGDIISATLDNAIRWADKIVVLDNGSSDNSWEIVNNSPSSKVIPFERDEGPYSDGFRARIFEAFKDEMTDSDWWVIQDGDEHYLDNPREFIQNNEIAGHFVLGNKLDVYPKDYTEIGFNPSNFVKAANYTWSEPRLIRHRPGMVWSEKEIWPKPMGIQDKARIRIKHYPCRNKRQMEKRWKDRRASLERNGQYFNHWNLESWEDMLPGLKELIDLDPSNLDVHYDFQKIMNYQKQAFWKVLLYHLGFRLGLIK
ncbi:glycosyltransferase family 2 protein [Ekhidna sp.]|uniref:glycosyltransferase family 2 protein n=1 Tax=Ekhidna sp. TaxID=2608089 RepID=UPI0035199635